MPKTAAAAKAAADAVHPHLPESMDLRFSAAEKFFAKKITLTRADFDALVAEAQLYAFTVARISSIQLIADIQAEVQRAIIEGTTLEDFKKAMPGLMAKHGWSGTTPWHTETIFRTNVQMAYGMGQLEGMTAPHVLEAFPFWQYSAINDGRVRPSHLALDGKVYPADHSFWRTHFPPWGYNCRCDVIPLLPEQAEGLTIHTDDGPPKEGNFNGPGHALDELKKAQSAKEIAQGMMPKLTPLQEGALMDKLDADVPLGLKVEGLTAPAPVIDVVPVTKGPTLAELEEAHAENAKLDKIAKRKAQIKAAQATYAAKKKAEKEVAKKLAVAQAQAEAEAALAAKKADALAFVKETAPTAIKTKQIDLDKLVDSLVGEKDWSYTTKLLLKAEKLAIDAEKAAEAAAAAVKEAERQAAEALKLKKLKGKLTKEELAALTPEEKAARRAEQIRNARENAKQKKAAGIPTKARQTVPINESGDPLQQLSKLDYAAGDLMGVDVPRDATLVEGHNLNVRLVTDTQGRKMYEFAGKVTDDEVSRWANNNREYVHGGKRDFWGTKPGVEHVEGSARMSPNFRPVDRYSLGDDRLRRFPDGTEIRISSQSWGQVEEASTGGMFENKYTTLANSFRIRIPRTGNDAADFARFKEAIEQTPLKPLLEPVTLAERKRVGMIRAIVGEQPYMLTPKGGSYNVEGGSLPLANRPKIPRDIAEKLDPASLKRGLLGVKAKDLHRLTAEELTRMGKAVGIDGLTPESIEIRHHPRLGYSAPARKLDIDHGGTRVYHGSSAPAGTIADILQDGRLLSSYHRIRAGALGVLNEADFSTGGAESLFLRVITRAQAGSVNMTGSFGGGRVQFVFKARILEQLDTYAFDADRFGRAFGQTTLERVPMKKFVTQKAQGVWERNNEIMPRRGLSLDDLSEVACVDQSTREEVLRELRARGMTHINGRRIEDVVVVRRNGAIDRSMFD